MLTYLKLFVCFLKVGLFSIGGGYAAMPVIQSQVVNNNWLSMEEFCNLITIAEMTPGPVTVNSATFVGIRIAGIGGAVAATFGCILPSMIIVSLLSYIYFKFRQLHFIKSVLETLRPIVVALIAGSGLAILKIVLYSEGRFMISNINVMGIMLIIVAFIVLRKKKNSPIMIIAACGVINLLIGLIDV